ncbi:MAG: ABC transporter ATP-binding protein [Candidatus Nanoarchaeia archaeon]
MIFLTLVTQGSYVIDKWIFKEIVDRSTEFTTQVLPKDMFIVILLQLAALYAIIVAIRPVSGWIKIHLNNKTATAMMNDIKRELFSHVMHLSHDFHTTHKTGSLISRIIRGAWAVDQLNDVLMYNMASFFMQALIVSVSLMYFSLVPAIVLAVTVILFVGYSVYIQYLQEPHAVAANDEEDVEKAQISDFLMNIDSIKYFGKEQAIRRRFRKVTDKTRAAHRRFWDYFSWMDAGQQIIIGVGFFLLIYFPIVEFLNGKITLGTLTFIYAVFTGLVGHLFGFVWGIRNGYKALADLESLLKYKKMHNEVLEHTDSKAYKVKKGEIEFVNLHFKYHKRWIFKRFNLKIPRNNKVAFVGHSGSGKSTLVKLLYRLFDVNKGQILIDGHDIRDFKKAGLRSELSIVPQECMLFDDTIYNNVVFSKPGATRRQVMKAIKFAQLDKVIKNFPIKERTIVGERGVKLSGGEKQRVSIARALLANKKILVLDEATSALDSETEHEIQKDLEKLMQGRTSIIIAHRLSTIMKADIICVLQKGKIVQMGTHKQLIKQRGEYKKLWNLQKGGYIK